MNTRDFLDAVKRRHGLKSDYALSKYFGWQPSRVSTYRTTPRELDDAACFQVAHALGEPPGYVLAEIAAARAKDSETAAVWRGMARLLKKSAAACVLAAALVGGHDASAATSGPIVSMVTQSIHYAHYRLRRALARLAGALKRFARCLDAGAFPPLSVYFQQ